ncbi:MAG: YdbL family protein [Gammaproteobacteria bacterium]
MKVIQSMLLGLLILVSSAAFALSLSDAKSQGLVGEKGDGFIAAVPANVTPAQASEIQALVNSINQSRLQEYQSIAANNGASIHHVESVAGETLINLAKPGEYIMTSSGDWVKKQ